MEQTLLRVRSRPELVAAGQLWRSTGVNGSELEVEKVLEGRYFKREIAMIVPTEFAEIKFLAPTRLAGKTGSVRLLDFGISYQRLPEADERFESAEEALEAAIIGWSVRCEVCGGHGGDKVIDDHGRWNPQRRRLCHHHIAEWRWMVAHQEGERQRFFAGNA